MPFGVEVVQVTPSAVAMAFEASASRAVPVMPAVDGRPAPGYVVGPMTRRSEDRRRDRPGERRATERPKCSPSRCRSPARRRRCEQSVILGLLDPSLRLKSARSAVVTVQIVPAPLERALHNRPVHLRNLDAGAAGRGRSGGRGAVAARQPRGAEPRRSRRHRRPISISPASVPANTPSRCTRSRHPMSASRASSRRLCRCGSASGKMNATLFGTDGVRGTAGRYPLDRADRPPPRRGAREARWRAGGAGRAPRDEDSRGARHARVGQLDRSRARARRVGRRRIGNERRRRADAGRRLPHAIAAATTRASSSPLRTIRSKTTASKCSPAAAKNSPSVSSARSRRIIADTIVARARGRAGARAARGSGRRVSRSSARGASRSGVARRASRSRSTARTARRRPWRRSCSAASASRSIVIGDRPDGRNINLNCGSTHPEAARANRGRARLPDGRRVRRRRRPRDLRRSHAARSSTATPCC